MSRKALVLLVCCCDFRDGAERLMPSKSLGNAVIRAFPGLFRILRMCAPRRAAAVVRPRGREKSADRRRRILISRLLIIRASVPRRKSPFPAYFKGFPAVSLLIPPYPAFLKYPVSPHPLTTSNPVSGRFYFILFRSQHLHYSSLLFFQICARSHSCRTANCSSVWNQCSPSSMMVRCAPVRCLNCSSTALEVRLSFAP